ncbi:hypothetical protein HYPSUDRAFT_88505 [Hypholoma sublateritium FD-334 SS-4]|uniref:Ribonuclease H2 subunit B n=1 Tax=Hypholoma sublateritium (strain FD-334 SS-4) TaxID=945553 RepID=A0A0D2L268_HYPSF|nr:hypothetical protein HYPSUDRAFT_88505 [Hypholoma sublateritium FD-334 SS-4]
MNTHFCVMPIDIIQSISQPLQLEENSVKPKLWNESRMLRLPHPRTGLPSLFLPSESEKASTVLEIQAVAPPDERSWMTGEEIVADGRLLIMTPVDPSFLLLPILQVTQPTDESLAQFKPADDLFDEAAGKFEPASESESDKASSSNSQDILEFCSLSYVRRCLRHVCETKEITPELTVYRYSQSKVLEYMRAKVAHLSTSEKFAASQTVIRNLARDGLMEDGKEELLSLGRLRAACDMISQYLPSVTRDALVNSYDFAILQTQLNINKEEAMANAVSSASKLQAKGQKAVPDKKRKAPKPSFGVEKLKKANTTGMSKLSSFFNKA